MRTAAMPIELVPAVTDRPAQTSGFAVGGVHAVLRLEGAAAFAAAVALYAYCGFSWPLFALFFLAPDLFMLGYLAGPRSGTAAYNLAHTYTVALAIAVAGLLFGAPIVVACGLILAAHIGFDRALGFGAKYATAFGHSHLGRVGRSY
jgi:hypothetical protein